MNKTGKIVVGCLAAVVLTGTCVGVGFMYGAFKLFSWGKTQVHEAAGGLEKLQQAQRETEILRQQANASTFTRPADERLSEERLLKFLAVRRDVHAVYAKHRTLIESQGPAHKPTLSDLGQVAQILSDIRLAQARAQAREGLSDDEYAFLVGEVYKSAWARALTEGSNGPAGSPSTRLGQGLDEAEAALRTQLEDPNLPEATRQALEQQLEAMRQVGKQAREHAKALDVPPENIALLKQHEAEIKQYTMGGLELIGL